MDNNLNDHKRRERIYLSPEAKYKLENIKANSRGKIRTYGDVIDYLLEISEKYFKGKNK